MDIYGIRDMSLINQMLRDLESRNPSPKPSSILHDNIKLAETTRSKTPMVIGGLLALILTAGGSYWGYQKTQAKPQTISVADNLNKDIVPIAPYEEVLSAPNAVTKPAPKIEQKTENPVTRPVQPVPVVQAAPAVQSAPITQTQPETVVEPAIKRQPISSKESKRLSAKQQADTLFRQVENNFENYSAVSKLEQVLRLDPRHLKARLMLAKTLHNQGQVDKTADFLDQSLALFPDNLQFINTRAQIFLQQKNPNGALRTLQHVDLTNSSNETYLSLLAASYQQQQSFANAASVYQRLVTVNSEKAENWLGLALSHEKLGNTKLAREAYQQALGKNTLKQSVADYVKQRLIELR